MTAADVERLTMNLPLPETVFGHARTWRLQRNGWLSCAVAYVDETAVGRGLVIWGGYQVAELLPFYAGVPVLREMYVQAGWRRQHIGSQILGFLEMMVAAQGVDSVALGVRPDNVQAKRLWLRRGFVPHGPCQVETESSYLQYDGSLITRREVFIPLLKELSGRG